MRFDLEVKGDKVAIAKIDELSDRAGDLQPVFRAAGEIIAKGLKRQFETRGAYLGGKGTPWKPLAAATVERKSRQGLPADVLVAAGALAASLTGGKGHVLRIAKTQVRVGTKDFKARFHQGGTSQGEPARKLVGIAKNDREAIFRLVRKHLTV